jgi:hypothetical protein
MCLFERSKQMTERDWPTREQWARNRTTVFAGDENPHPASRRLSDYASADEIAAAIEAIKAARLQTLRTERAADLALGLLGRQRGESRRGYETRFRTMSRAEQDRVIDSVPSSYDLHELNETLKQLKGGVVPWRRVWAALGSEPAPLSPIMARYEAALKQTHKAWEQEVAQTPVDDAAWAKELEWRRKCDDDDAHPERFRHRV